MSTQPRSMLARLEHASRLLENVLIAILLGALIVLASSQIVMRNVFSSSLSWGDELIRLLVLWLALVGALAASRDARQIRIDVLPRLLSERWVWLPECVTAAFTVVVCALLAWHSTRFLLDSMAFEDLLLGELPAWWFQLILPVGFGVMAFRYAVRTARAALRRE